jgi:hypothetical protein
MQKGFVLPSVILLVVLPLAGFFLGMQYKQSSDSPTIIPKCDGCNQKLIEKEEELKLCIQDSAKAGSPYKTAYSFKELGLYSKLFEGKEIENTVYSYKGQTIVKKEITLEQSEEKNSATGVKVWEYESSSGTTKDDNRPYVVFDGYENYMNRPRVLDINLKGKDSYTNPNNIKMDWGYIDCPKAACGVTLSFFSQYTPAGHPIYVQIWASSSSYSSEGGLNSPNTIQAKDKLEKIADSIEDSSTYH